jgi:hypothetical protein
VEVEFDFGKARHECEVFQFDLNRVGWFEQ